MAAMHAAGVPLLTGHARFQASEKGEGGEKERRRRKEVRRADA